MTARATESVSAVIGFGMLALIWQLAPTLGLVNAHVLPPLSTTLGTLPSIVASPTFGESVVTSAARWGLGLGLAVVAGVGLGVWMASSSLVAGFFNPLLVASHAVPKAALVILIALWLGLNLLTVSSVVMLGTMVPITFATYHAVGGVDERLRWSAQSLGTPVSRLWSQVSLPAVLPAILGGCRIALGSSYLTVIGAEFLIRQAGIGTLLFSAMDEGRFPAVWAIGLLIGTVGVLLDLAFVVGAHRVVRWYEGEL